MKKEELVKTLVETQVKTASEGRNADLDQTAISQVVVRVKAWEQRYQAFYLSISLDPMLRYYRINMYKKDSYNEQILIIYDRIK